LGSHASTAIQHAFNNSNQSATTSSSFGPHMPSTAIREGVWYHLKNLTSPNNNVSVDDSRPKHHDDVQITLEPENASHPGQYWNCEPNANVGFWTISNMEFPQMALDVYGNNIAHPRLALTEYVTGQQWQAVNRGNGAVSLWNNYSGRDMYLSLSDNPRTPMRLTLSHRDNSNQSQLWSLHAVSNIEQESYDTKRILPATPQEGLVFKNRVGENELAHVRGR
jgi:hypothetical protein